MKEWIHTCPAGVYKTDTLVSLVWTIFTHRLHHFLKGEGFTDQMSQSIDIYLTYCAMKAHFGKGDYDFVKFNGKTKVSRESFWKRKDRVWFVMLGRKLNSYLIESVEDYLLANFIVETKGYIGNFNDQNYFDWKDRM